MSCARDEASQLCRPASLDLTLVLLFLAGLFASLFAHWLYGDAQLAVKRELRRPAPRPEWSWDLAHLANFPASFEAWHADTFGLRDQLVRWHNLEKLFVFHTTPVPSLFLGKDGWIFYTSEQSRENWRGLLPFSTSDLVEWRRALEARRDWCARRGIAYLFALAPNKETIYPEYLPASETKHGPTRRESFFPWLKEHSDVPVLDLADCVRAERAFDVPAKQDFAFNPLGTHWTSRGGWAGAEALAAELARRFPAIPPGRHEDWHVFVADGEPDSWALSLLCEDLVTEPIYGFAPRGVTEAHGVTPTVDGSAGSERAYANPHTELPSILLLHDSFGPTVETPLAEQASRLITLAHDEFLEQRIVLDRPQILIEMYTERRLTHFPPWDMQAGVRIQPSEFDAGLRARPDLDRVSLLAAIEPVGGTSLSKLEGGHALVIVTTSDQDKLLLPALDPPQGHSLCLSLDIEAPESTVLSLWYQTKDDPNYHDECKLTMSIDAGLSTQIVRLPVPGLQGRLMLQPGWTHGRYVLRGLDLRW